MNPLGSVVSLHIVPSGAAAMQSISAARAVVGRGLDGDRYCSGLGTYSKDTGGGRDITLIEVEAIEALKREYDVSIEPGQSRRNVVTRGLALNHLVGKDFVVGEARLRGVRLCEPCAHLERLSARGAMRGLIHRGGLRADIVTSGMIRIGDVIASVEEHAL